MDFDEGLCMVNDAGLLAVFGRQEDSFGVESSYVFHVATYRLLHTQSTLATERALAQAWGSYVRQGPYMGSLDEVVESRSITPPEMDGVAYCRLTSSSCSFFEIPTLQDSFCERGFSTYVKQSAYSQVFGEGIDAYVRWLDSYGSRIDFFEQKQVLHKNNSESSN